MQLVKKNTLMNSLLEKLANTNPSTLSGISIVGAWLAAGLMIPATIKATKKVEKEKPEGIWNTVKCVAPCYIPPLSALVVSTGCGIASNSLHVSQNASAVAIATVAEHGLTECKEMIQETQQKNSQNLVKDNPPRFESEQMPKDSVEIREFGPPKCICMESYTRKYFWFAPADLERIQMEITKELTSEGEFMFGDLMYKFGMEPINDSRLGFTAEDYFSGGEIQFEFRTSTATAPDGRAVLVIDYWVRPHTIDE